MEEISRGLKKDFQLGEEGGLTLALLLTQFKVGALIPGGPWVKGWLLFPKRALIL